VAVGGRAELRLRRALRCHAILLDRPVRFAVLLHRMQLASVWSSRRGSVANSSSGTNIHCNESPSASHAQHCSASSKGTRFRGGRTAGTSIASILLSITGRQMAIQSEFIQNWSERTNSAHSAEVSGLICRHISIGVHHPGHGVKYVN
jgi:hypothetical protein